MLEVLEVRFLTESTKASILLLWAAGQELIRENGERKKQGGEGRERECDAKRYWGDSQKVVNGRRGGEMEGERDSKGKGTGESYEWRRGGQERGRSLLSAETISEAWANLIGHVHCSLPVIGRDLSSHVPIGCNITHRMQDNTQVPQRTGDSSIPIYVSGSKVIL